MPCLRFVDLLDLRFLEATPDSVAAHDGTSDRYTPVNTGARSRRRRRTEELRPSSRRRLRGKIVKDADYDALAVTTFGEVFKAEGLRIITTSPRTPSMNVVSERVIGTPAADCRAGS